MIAMQTGRAIWRDVAMKIKMGGEVERRHGSVEESQAERTPRYVRRAKNQCSFNFFFIFPSG